MNLKRFAEFSDILIPALILMGVIYPTLVWIGHKTGLHLILPSAFTSARGTAISSLLFGLGLVLAGTKYAATDPPAAKFYKIAGCFLIVLAAFIMKRRSGDATKEAIGQREDRGNKSGL